MIFTWISSNVLQSELISDFRVVSDDSLANSLMVLAVLIAVFNNWPTVAKVPKSVMQPDWQNTVLIGIEFEYSPSIRLQWQAFLTPTPTFQSQIERSFIWVLA